MESLTLNRMYLARLLSGRPSRMGWRAPWRQVWPHPGTVERATPASWPGWGRRCYLMLQNLGLASAAERLRRTLDARHDSPCPPPASDDDAEA